jgi:HEAT repeat protein
MSSKYSVNSMSNRGVTLLWFGAAATVVALVLSVLPLQEPTHGGKSMRVWFDEIYAQGIENAEAQATLMHFKADAVPVLRRELRAHDSPMKLRIMQLLSQQKVWDVRFTLAEERHRRAMRLCGLLGPAAREAIPELARLLAPFTAATEEAASALARMDEDAVAPLSQAVTNSDRSVRETAVGALGMMQEKARAAVPVLALAIADPDQRVRYYAAGSLGQIAAETLIAVPALVNGLNDSDEAVRRSCAQALGAFGRSTSNAVPALVRATKDSALLVRLSARNALGAIDPDAAPPAPRLDQEISGETQKSF